MESYRFRDFDEFSASVRDIDATMMLPQIPKRRLWSTNHVYLPQTHLQLGRLGSGNIVEGESWSNGYVLYLPLTKECAYSSNGIVLSKDSFMVLEPGCDFCISTKEEHDWCSLLVPTREMNRYGEREGRISEPNSKTCRVVRTNARLAQKFWTLVSQVMTAAANCQQFESSQAAKCAEADLLEVSSSVLGYQKEPARFQDRRLPRSEIVRRSKELLERHEGKRLRVEELVAAAEVSERTLRTVFNEYFGVGPNRYLQLRQLHQVRRALKGADPEASTVADVLIQHGEWEFGRFAARYQRLFAEKPSDTLRRKNR